MLQHIIQICNICPRPITRQKLDSTRRSVGIRSKVQGHAKCFLDGARVEVRGCVGVGVGVGQVLRNVEAASLSWYQ